jgi:hypothetical protein
MTLEAKKSADEIFDGAYTDALLYGVGIIRMANTQDGIQMTHVPREEFMDLAKHLEFVTANIKDFTDKPTKG